MDDDTLMSNDSSAATDRRAFFGRMTTTALAVAAAGVPLHALAAESTPDMHPPADGPWSDAWLASIKGKHRQFFRRCDTE